jgi:excisionase family DNA binding protein
MAREQHPYLYAPEAAALLRVHVETLYRMIERGEVPATKVARRWRISREYVETMLAGETPLDAKCEAALERWLANAPPLLSEAQKDTIAAAFAGAFPTPGAR